MSDDKAELKKQIDEKLALLTKTLKEAQAIADEHGMTFTVRLGLPDGNKGEGYVGYQDYHDPTFSATYHGTKSEVDESAAEELDADVPDDQLPMNKEGYWYWNNSSMNC
jgi:hypothetical protein